MHTMNTQARTLLQQLRASRHLLEACGPEYARKEQRALTMLLGVPRPTFLQRYDILFRWVSLWLLEKGYALTNEQPHQVLAKVCGLFTSAEQVQGLVRARHGLKYEQATPSTESKATLENLLKQLKKAVETERTERNAAPLPRQPCME